MYHLFQDPRYKIHQIELRSHCILFHFIFKNADAQSLVTINVELRNILSAKKFTI